jgi:ABC-type multidrug transport system ATPase subunit
MKLNLTTKYKSLTPPITIDVPDFTILTGVNGAGKTHLLSALASGIFQLTDSGALLNPLNSRTACKYVTSHSLTPNDSVVITSQELNQNIQNLWTQYHNFQQSLQTRPGQKIEHSIGDIRLRNIIEAIAKDAKKGILELTSDDFYTYYPLDDALHHDVFYQNFSSLFKRYHDKWDANLYKRYQFEKREHTGIEFLTDEEFLKKFGEPPWDFVNRIIKEAKLDYHINSPTFHRDAPFELKLINNLSGAEIQFSELSSGEKVLMSLALALYNSQFDFEFPKVLLLDEPDASLHPSMSKQFLDVLEKVFVKEKGVKVIITTHSPSTVALCNEENLFVMNKTGQRIEKITKDKALRILTAGVPSLSINYENRRQVFVESKYDAFFYEKVYDKLRSNLINEVSLNFISSGVSGAGNSDQVKDVVNKLSGYGNKFIFGIIDWDLKNTAANFIKVLGENKRYSIENYIFDPLLISALLLMDRLI